MRSRFAAVLFICTCYAAYGKSDSTSIRPSWFLSLNSGALIAKPGNGTTASTTIMQGIRLNRVSFGVGAGYDTYLNWQTLPVSAGVSFDVIKRDHHALFFQLNTGYSPAWYRHRSEEQFDYDAEGGFFYHPQLGYRVHEGKFTLYFSAGYKLQRLTYEQSPRWWMMTGTAMKQTVVRDMERLSISIGLGLW